MFPFVEVPELSTAIAPVYPGMSTIALTFCVRAVNGTGTPLPVNWESIPWKYSNEFPAYA